MTNPPEGPDAGQDPTYDPSHYPGWQNPYGQQNPYGPPQDQQNPYGPPRDQPAGPPLWANAPGSSVPPPGSWPSGPPRYTVADHPKTQTVFLLGLLGLLLCQVLSPFAWVMGKKALNEIDASGGAWGGRSQVNTGYILGIIGSVLLVFVCGFGLLAVVGLAIGAESASP